MKKQTQKLSSLKFTNSVKQNYSVTMALYIIIAIFSVFAEIMSMYFFIKVTPSDIANEIKNYTNIVCLIMIVNAIALAIVCGLAKKNNKPFIHKGWGILNLVATAGITLSMFITLFFISSSLCIC